MMQHAPTQDRDGQAKARRTPLPLRDDTILGVCEALGEDFRFNPIWLRAALAAGLLWNPAAIVGIYLGLAAIVAISRLLFPATTAGAAIAEQSTTGPSDEPAIAEVEKEREYQRELIAA